MERRILVGAAEPVLDMQQYRFWHITAIGQKITSNGSLPLCLGRNIYKVKYDKSRESGFKRVECNGPGQP